MNFCLSTEMIDLHNQAPNRNQRECKFYWDEAYTLICGAGFTDIEIPYEPKWDFGGRSGIPRTLRSITTKFKTVKNYMNMLKDIGIQGISSVHLDPSMFCSGNADMYFGAMEHFAAEAIDFCRQAGTKFFILTATPPIAAIKALENMSGESESWADRFLEKNKQVIARLASDAAKNDVTLCLKNEYWGLLRGSKIIDYVRQIQSDLNGIPVLIDADTAQLQIAGENPSEFIKNNRSLIGTVHFSDTAFIDNDNVYASPSPEFPCGQATQIFKDLGQGNVAFPEIYQQLLKSGFHGPVIVNAKQTRDFPRSLLRARYYIGHTLHTK